MITEMLRRSHETTVRSAAKRPLMTLAHSSAFPSTRFVCCNASFYGPHIKPGRLAQLLTAQGDLANR